MLGEFSYGHGQATNQLPVVTSWCFNNLQFDLDWLLQGTPVGRKWTKRVQKEWKILENNLPGTRKIDSTNTGRTGINDHVHMYQFTLPRVD